MPRRLLAAVMIGGAVLALAACGDSPPVDGTAVAQANRAILATFNVPISATLTAPIGVPRPVATAPTVTLVVTPPAATPTYAVMRQRLIAAEMTLITGEFDVTIAYDNETRTMETIRFDLGREVGVPRAQSTITYQSAVATRSIEVITMGSQAWQRTPPGSWTTTDRPDSTRAQVLGLLPRAEMTATVAVEGRGNTAVLRWYDAERASDTEVEIDPVTGIPQRLQRRGRADGFLLTVTYRRWNTPITIDTPDGS